MERKCVKTYLILPIILLAGTSDILFLLRFSFYSIEKSLCSCEKVAFAFDALLPLCLHNSMLMMLPRWSSNRRQNV